MAEVAREEHAPPLPISTRAFEFQQYEARPEYVPGDVKARPHARRNLRRLARVRASMNQLQSGVRVRFRVERERGRVSREVVAVAILRLLLLQTRGVRQQQLQEVCRPLRPVDRPLVPA